ncbi:MAG: AAA family ATPase, partial [Nitrospinaceae bacterium]|nr:AAA family ATPase [Nitrospinaceae bacterium]
EARALLDAVLTRMMEAVHRYEGTVNQVMGDGIMALFGAPLALEDHALRACYAALAIQSAINSYADEARREMGVEVNVRVGLNSGEVVVRSIGSDLKMDYTAVGQTVNLAARMEQIAPPGGIRMTAETLRFAEGFVQVESLGPVPIKGLPEAVEIFELLGAASGRTRFQATASGGLTKFVGRRNELEDLEEALGKSGEGQGQVFATVAEAGVGKSRLYWEFIRSPRTKEWLVVESGSVSYGKATAYKPVIDLLKAYFSIEDTDGHRRIREKVTGKILTLDESLTTVIPPVLSLLEVPIEDEGWNNLDPAQRRRRTLDGVKGLMLREAKVQPLCLVFEDLHWIDTETQALLDSMVESLPSTRVLLLVNYRPEYEHGWANKSYYTRLRLDPLSSEGAEELLAAILGGNAALGPLKTLLIERTQGNPFYLEESVQTLIESEALAGDPGAYKLTEDVAKIEVPPTVQAILAARIDRLPPEDKRLLQTASVIGTHVPCSLLSAIAGMSEEELQRGLATLQASEFLYETNLFPEREFTFKHALTHEVTYGGLVQDRKRALHAAIVGAIEESAGYRLDEQIERLAHHAYEGEEWEKALTYSQQAGEKALMRSAYHDALNHFERALITVPHIPENREKNEQVIDVFLALHGAIIPLGKVENLLNHLRKAETLAQQINDDLRLGRCLQMQTQFYFTTGDWDRALDSALRTIDAATKSGDVYTQFMGKTMIGMAHCVGGDLHSVKNALDEVVAADLKDWEKPMGLGLNYPSMLSRSFLSRCMAEYGEFDTAIALHEESIRIAETCNEPVAIAQCCRTGGMAYIFQGDFSSAISLSERGIEISNEWNIQIFLHRLYSALGYAHGMEGRHSEADALFEKSDVMETSIKNKGFDLNIHYALRGKFYLLAGRVEVAVDLAARALRDSRECKERGSEAWTLCLYGDIHSHPDAFEPEKAEENYRQALALAGELGMRPLTAHCRKGLGALYGKTGREDEGRNELTTAMDMYRDMEMAFWLEKAEAAMAEAG